MSITAYVGLPGHGKSYGVVANVIKPALESKRVVYTNIPMNTDVCLNDFGMSVVQFDTQDLIDNPNWFDEVFEKGSLFVFDEVWRLWPSGLKANNAIEQHKSFLAEHRHMVGDSGHSTEIVLVTQDLSQLAAFSRALVETTYKVEKLSKLGQDKRFRVDVFSGSVTGAKPPLSKREREIHGKFKPEIYKLYKSHTKSDVGAGIEDRTDNRFNVLKGGAYKAVFIGFILMLFGLWYLSSKFINESDFIEHDKPVELTQSERLEILKSKSLSDSNVLASNSVQSSSVPTVSTVVKTKSEDLISSINSVYVIGSLIMDEKRVFSFKVIFKDSSALVTNSDFEKLDYKLDFISPCLVKIYNEAVFKYASCKDSTVNNQGLITL